MASGGRDPAGVAACDNIRNIVLVGKTENGKGATGNRLFDDGTNTIDEVSREIVRCMTLAKEGIHAFIMVLSTKSPFTEEDAKSIDHLQTLFGPGAVDRMMLSTTISRRPDF
ncbi:hypothetical protein Tsubulata_031842 [Turnera subulata]|uniref:AIG1-type G domain-containing protein n=1 Tax=Turnera subulata TaxID=218843 RepID=A0A9Q0JF72_9ROSI|nr:hypothetical protein Tsubulata_031842 [Turnera subulata]